MIPIVNSEPPLVILWIIEIQKPISILNFFVIIVSALIWIMLTITLLVYNQVIQILKNIR
jgi:hypothetical protein